MYLADCVLGVCEWDHLCKTEEFGKILEVIHQIKRHPEAYQNATGKDPDQWLFIYKEQVEAYGHLT